MNHRQKWLNNFTFCVIVMAVTIMLFYKPLFSPTLPKQLGFQSSYSATFAINKKLCGKWLYLSSQYKVPTAINVTANKNIPIRSIPTKMATDQDAYCETVVQPMIIGESTLRAMYLIALTLKPNATLNQIAIFFNIIKLLCIFIFIYSLSLSQISKPLIGLSALFIMSVLAYGERYTIAIHSLTLPALLGYIGLLMVAYQQRFTENLVKFTLVTLVIIISLFVIMNLRISTLPILIMTALFTVACSIYHNFHLRSKKECLKAITNRTAIIVLLSTVAFTFLHYPSVAFKQRNLDQLPEFKVLTHPTIHPLVLGLAVPQNKFSRKEGIKWLDANGVKHANKVNPSVNALYSDAYYQALWQYYRGLWSKQTRSMVQTYYLKMKTAGADAANSGIVAQVTNQHFDNKYMRIMPRLIQGPELAHIVGSITLLLVAPYTLFHNGLLVILFIILYGLRKCVDCFKTESNYNLMMLLLTAAMLGTTLEAAIIFSTFTVMYHSFMLFYILFSSALLWRAGFMLLKRYKSLLSLPFVTLNTEIDH